MLQTFPIMSRAAKFFGTLAVSLAAWTFLVFFDENNVLNLTSDVHSVIVAVCIHLFPQPRPATTISLIAQLPAYALMVFGCYALFTIGSELFSYRDCDDAAVELKEVCPALHRSIRLSSRPLCRKSRKSEPT